MMLYLYVDSLSEAVYVPLSVRDTYLFGVIMLVCQVFSSRVLFWCQTTKLQTPPTTCERVVSER